VEEHDGHRAYADPERRRQGPRQPLRRLDLGIPKNSDNSKAAWDLVRLLGSKKRELEWDIKNVQIPVRKDVAADPSYAQANPTNSFFASLVPITDYRPAYSVYPRISKEIQAATESVVTGSASPSDAAKQYDQQVKGIAGNDVTSASGS